MAPSHPRRQQIRRLRRAARRGAEGVAALAAALALARIGLTGPAVLATVLGLASLAAARRWWRLAARSAIGADSEAQVRRALVGLAREGWRVSHGVNWPAGGDLDHVVRAPSGIGFVIETKTARYTSDGLDRAVGMARRLARRRRRYPRGVSPVVCVVRAWGVERVEHGALVVSLDRLPAALVAAAVASPPAATRRRYSASGRPAASGSA